MVDLSPYRQAYTSTRGDTQTRIASAANNQASLPNISGLSKTEIQQANGNQNGQSAHHFQPGASVDSAIMRQAQKKAAIQKMVGLMGVFTTNLTKMMGFMMAQMMHYSHSGGRHTGLSQSQSTLDADRQKALILARRKRHRQHEKWYFTNELKAKK